MSLLKTISKNREAFLKFNDEKVNRFHNLIPNTTVRRVVNSIPLMLSVNEKKIPGYVEGDVLFGIVNYKPDEQTEKFVRGRFHINRINYNEENPFIEMLAVMGSVGTIAYTKESDFDYWVCIDKRGVSADLLKKFQKKVEAIQDWLINEIKIDVHLFINDIESIKNNIFAEDEDEAFGTTIGAVLKDEFFRSSIIVAGKVPFWWVIPRFITDNEYEKLFSKIPKDIRESEFIDLGNLYNISKEDFLGAALFQVIKSLGNPFKSIIKIGVLEKYLYGTDDSPLLSQRVKLNMLHDKLTNKILDSYILMFDEVYSYYETAEDNYEILKVLKQNLYLKINPQLSKYIGLKHKQKLPYKVSIMFTYIKKWGWKAKHINLLDNFDNWDYNEVMAFWNSVKKFMLLSYQKITKQLPTLNLSQHISESDFKLISRKIKTHFSSEENKIDYYVTFKDIPYESIIYIEPTNKSIEQHEWRLYKRDTSSEDKFVSTTLRTENDLIKLIAWTAINDIFHPKFSRLKIQSGYSRIDQNLVVELMTKISNLFASHNVKLKNEFFLNPAFNIANMILLNFNLEKEESIKTIHYIYKTSWGESYIEKYSSTNELMKVLEKALNDGLQMQKGFDDYCVIVSPESFRKFYKEIETFFREAYKFIVSTKSSDAHRMITYLGNSFVVITKQNKKVTIETFENMIKMFTSISLSPRHVMQYRFLGDETRVSILRDVFKIRTESAITIIYEEIQEALIIHVINEKRNIFTFVRSSKQKEEYLMYLYGFCLRIIDYVNKTDSLAHIKEDIETYKLAVDKFEKHEVENQTRWFEEMYLLKYKMDKPFVATIDRSVKNNSRYKFIFNNQNETGEFGLKDISAIIKQLKAQGWTINNMVSDMVCLNLDEVDRESGSSVYLLEKYRIELLINKAFR